MSTQHRGTSLVELMVAMAAASIVTFGALRLATGFMHYGRVTSIQADVVDRSRLVREFITRDVMQAGFYWTHEGSNDDPNNPLKTGTFGTAARATSIDTATWPRYPLVGTNNSGSPGAPDIIRMLIPRDDVSGLSAQGSQCCETGGCGNVTLAQGINPLPTSWTTSTSAFVIAGTGITALTTLVSTGANPVFQSLRNTTGNNCQAGGAALGNGASLPGAIVAYPVLGVSYIVATGTTDLYRCETNNPLSGPLAVGPGSVAASPTCVLLERGVEDLQYRYLFSVHNETPTASVVACDDPGDIMARDAGGLHDMDNRTCLGSAGVGTKLQQPNGATNAVRLTGVRVGLVIRSMSQDSRNYTNRSRQPNLFDRVPGLGSDSYRRRTVIWDIAVPNAFAYGTGD